MPLAAFAGISVFLGYSCRHSQFLVGQNCKVERLLYPRGQLTTATTSCTDQRLVIFSPAKKPSISMPSDTTMSHITTMREMARTSVLRALP